MAGISGTLVICDGGPASLVALSHATDRAGESPGASVLPLIADNDRARRRAIERAATLAGATLLPWPALDRDVLGSPSRMLLAATALMTENGSGAGAWSVVWPASSGRSEDPSEADAARAADIAETAMLVERLASLESGRRIRIEAPFADLPDASICELALDAGVRPSGCWWWAPDDEEARVAFERWRTAFASVGLPFESLAESKPAAAGRAVLPRHRAPGA